jgi:hypothetical protein
MTRILRPAAVLAVVAAFAGWTLSCDQVSPVAPTGSTLTVSANPAEISLDGASTITVVGRKMDGNPLNPGTQVRLSTTLGKLDSELLDLDSSGVATTKLRGQGRIGMATVTATSGALDAVTVDVQVGRTAGAVSLQATPTSVAESGGSVSLLALVRDSQGQPLASVPVNFSTDVGTLESGGAFIDTDDQGQARDTLDITEGDVQSVSGDSFSVSVEASAGSTVQNDQVSLSILRRPIASFSFTRSQLTVAFMDTSTGNPTKWEWDFGDGTAHSTSRNPAHQYSQAGTYIVTLTVTNSVGEGTVSQSVSVTTQ